MYLPWKRTQDTQQVNICNQQITTAIEEAIAAPKPFEKTYQIDLPPVHYIDMYGISLTLAWRYKGIVIATFNENDNTLYIKIGHENE